MKNIHLNLCASADLHSGMAVYSTEIIKRIMSGNELKIEGGVCFNIKKRNNLKEIALPIKVSLFPYKYIFKKKIINLSYNKIMRTKAEYFIFFANEIPLVKINGKVVVVIHDIIPIYLKENNPDRAYKFEQKVKYAIQNSDYIVTVSEHSKLEILEYFKCDSDKIKVVYNGVNYDTFNKELFPEQYIKARKEYKLPNKYILYFGNAKKYKNIANALKAYSLLPANLKKEYKFVLANSDITLKELVNKLSIKNDVWLLNGIKDEHKVAIYQKASLKIFISQYEGFGIPIIEAMAAGVPVITSNVSCLPEVAGEAAKLVNPNDIEEISRAMLEILIDIELRKNMIQKGFVNAKKYSWEKAASNFLEILKEL